MYLERASYADVRFKPNGRLWKRLASSRCLFFILVCYLEKELYKGDSIADWHRLLSNQSPIISSSASDMQVIHLQNRVGANLLRVCLLVAWRPHVLEFFFWKRLFRLGVVNSRRILVNVECKLKEWYWRGGWLGGVVSRSYHRSPATLRFDPLFSLLGCRPLAAVLIADVAVETTIPIRVVAAEPRDSPLLLLWFRSHSVRIWSICK